jgi:peroxiredoxin
MSPIKGVFLALSLLALRGTALADLPVRTGQPAPPFTLPRLPSGTLTLEQFRGKPVYMNFFASWCGPCAQEAPAVNAMVTKYQPRGLVALGVNELEDQTRALDFVNKYRLPSIILIDSEGTTGRQYGASIGLPINVFIDKRGRVSTWIPGPMSQSEIETAIKKIL